MEQRAKTFHQAHQELDHKNETMHDIEVEEGLVSSLCLQLGYLLQTPQPNVYDLSHVISLLSLSYQCSDSTRETSYHMVGRDLIRMMCVAFQIVKDTSEYIPCALPIMKVLRALSRLREASVYMVHQEDVLTILRLVVMDDKGVTDNDDGFRVRAHQPHLGSKLEAMATLKNISFFAEDFRLLMLQHPGLIDALLLACSDPENSFGREYASAVIRNLAMAPDTKVPMGGYCTLIDTLVQLMDDSNLKTRRNSVSAIGSLAISDENSIVFLTHGEGIIVKIMRRLIENECDAVIRRRAARALRCFGRKDTIDMLADRVGIINSLCVVAKDDPSVEAKIEAIEALACYISHAQSTAPYYNGIMDSIINIAKASPPVSCMETLAKTMHTLSCFEKHRIPMTNHHHLLKALTSIASHHAATIICREHAASTLFNLSCGPENRTKMVGRNVLSTLVMFASDEREESRNLRRVAVRTIVNLSLIEKNHKCLAREVGVLKCLIQFTLSSKDCAVKDEVKASMINLIPAL